MPLTKHGNHNVFVMCSHFTVSSQLQQPIESPERQSIKTGAETLWPDIRMTLTLFGDGQAPAN